MISRATQFNGMEADAAIHSLEMLQEEGYRLTAEQERSLMTVLAKFRETSGSQKVSKAIDLQEAIASARRHGLLINDVGGY